MGQDILELCGRWHFCSHIQAHKVEEWEKQKQGKEDGFCSFRSVTSAEGAVSQSPPAHTSVNHDTQTHNIYKQAQT